MPKYKDLYAKNLTLDRITDTETYIQPMVTLWNEIYTLYVCYTEDYASILSGEKANVFVPYVFSKIETKLPRIIQAMIGSDDWFKVIGVGEEDDPNAQNLDRLQKYQFQNEIDTYWFYLTWFKEALMYGNSFGGVFYDKVIKIIRKRFPRYTNAEGDNLYPQVLGYDAKPAKKTVYDGISLIPFDIFDCFPGIRGTKVNGLARDAMTYFILRSEPSASYFKSIIDNPEFANQNGWNIEAIKKLIKSKRGAGTMDKTRSERMSRRGMATIGNVDKEDPQYEMYTMWEDDAIVTLVENTVIRNVGPEKYPFDEMRKPIVMAMDTPVPHEIFALGQIKPILRLNYYAQDLVNAKLDNILDIVYPGYTASLEAFGATYIPILKQNMRGVHPVYSNRSTPVLPIQKPDKSYAATNEQLDIERLINMTLGSGDILSGQPDPKEQTLGEIEQQIEQSNYRFDLSVRLLKDFSQKELLLMMIDRNQQYMSDEKQVRIFGEAGKIERFDVGNENIKGSMDVIIKTSPLQGNKFAYAKNLLMFLELLSKYPMANPELVKRIGVSLGIDDAGTLMRNPIQEAIQLIAQAAQEGLLENPKQASLILGQVLNILAPPPPAGSPEAGKKPMSRTKGAGV